MSKLSFTTFCIEQYSDYTDKPSNVVYEIFKKTGLLELLREDYEDLHGMSIEWLNDFFDKYLKERQ